MADLVRFDWAMKRMLRDKANYAILEGLLTTLLGRTITIKSLLESDGNQQDEDDKDNRVDLLAEDQDGELMLVEVQNSSEVAYFQRMVFGVSKLLTEYMHKGDSYENIRKVYSINIVYFPLGVGTDYVYCGQTDFVGLHDGSKLKLSAYQQKRFDIKEVHDIFPTFYILRVNDFNKWSKVPLDQWMYFLCTSRIPQDADAPGLDEARKRLEYDSLSKAEKRAYDSHINNMVIAQDVIQTGIEEARMKAIEEGISQGLAKGREEERTQMARNIKALGVDTQTIAKASGLTEEEIMRL